MKKVLLYTILFLPLLTIASYTDTNFGKLYDTHGKKIIKGHIYNITDTSIFISGEKNNMEILKQKLTVPGIRGAPPAKHFPSQQSLLEWQHFWWASFIFLLKAILVNGIMLDIAGVNLALIRIPEKEKK